MFYYNIIAVFGQGLAYVQACTLSKLNVSFQTLNNEYYVLLNKLQCHYKFQYDTNANFCFKQCLILDLNLNLHSFSHLAMETQTDRHYHKYRRSQFYTIISTKPTLNGDDDAKL